MIVRRKVDFAAVTEEKLAIFIARRKKVNLAAGAKETRPGVSSCPPRLQNIPMQFHSIH